MSQHWHTVITNLSREELSNRKNAMGAALDDQAPEILQPGHKATSIADIMEETFPGEDWFVEQDWKGNVRVTLTFRSDIRD